MADRIAVLIVLFFINVNNTAAENDICNLPSTTRSNLILQTDGWITHSSCFCTVSLATDAVSMEATQAVTEAVPQDFSTTPPQTSSSEGLYLYTTSWLDVRKDEATDCPAQCDVSPSDSFTFHFCPYEGNSTNRGRMSTFYLTQEGVTIRLKNPMKQRVNLTMKLSGSGKEFQIACEVDNSSPKDDDSCPCQPDYTTDWPFYSETFSVSSRIVVGVVSAIVFILVIAGITGLLYYRARKGKDKTFENEKKDLANQNPAFESPDPMYAEIGQPKTPDRKLDLNQLPFTPDPNLRLGLDARYSMDSGLYSEPADVDRVVGHGALEGPSIMRISQTSLSRISQGSGGRNPVVMSPMTPDEIDALYAKPNKGKFAQQPKQDSTRNSSNQSLPSFRDPMGSQLQIPPPLATGSRSNSHTNIYNNAPLSLPLQQQQQQQPYRANSSQNLSSSMSINVSMQETDV